MAQDPSGRETVIPLVEEELTVGKRLVETGRVRIRTIVNEREDLVQQSLLGEDVEIERVPVGATVAEPPPVRQDGDTIIVPLLEEVLVLERRLVVREEVRIRRRRTETKVEHAVTLRSEDVVVERLDPRPGNPESREATEE